MGHQNNQGLTILFLLFWLLIGLTVWLGFLPAIIIIIGIYLILFFYIKKVADKTKNGLSDEKIYATNKIKEEIPILKRVKSLGVTGNLIYFGLLILFGFLICYIPVSIGWIRIILVFLTLLILLSWIDAS